MTDPTTGGTTEPEGRDAQATATTGTTVAAGADAAGAVAETPEQQEIARLKAENAKLAEHRDKRLAELETLERIKQENAELRQNGAGSTPPTATLQQQAQQLNNLYWQLKNSDDPRDQAMALTMELSGNATLNSQKQIEGLQRKLDEQQALSGVPAALQSRVRELHAAGYPPDRALIVAKAEDTERKQADLDRREAAIKQREAEIARGVQSIRVTPVAPSLTAKAMSEEDYAREMRRLAAEDRIEEATKLRERRRSGDLKVGAT